MEVARPDEGEHSAREAADETHQNGEMWNGYGHQDGEDDQSDSHGQSPDFELAVQSPHGRENGFGPALEESSFQQIHGRIIRQGVRQHGLSNEFSSVKQISWKAAGIRVYLYDQNEVDQSFEALRGQIVGDDFLGVSRPSQETDVAEKRFENGGRNVAPVEHALESFRFLHVAFQGRQEDLRRVAEDDDAQRNGESEDVDAQ